jgi:nickel superoxide dismutase
VLAEEGSGAGRMELSARKAKKRIGSFTGGRFSATILNMKQNTFKLFLLLLAGFLPAVFASAHCQIPCGIFEDDIVFGELMTDVATIEKSMKQINALGDKAGENPNQLVRWVTNKEYHAQNIQDVMAAYFLAQQIKMHLKESDPEKYAELLALVHKVTVLAMKTKQTTDVEAARKLHDALHAFQSAYSKS